VFDVDDEELEDDELEDDELELCSELSLEVSSLE
jgi:hypothetical protein